MRLKIPRALHWLTALEKGRLKHSTEPDWDEILGSVRRAADDNLPTWSQCSVVPIRIGRLFFAYWCRSTPGRAQPARLPLANVLLGPAVRVRARPHLGPMKWPVRVAGFEGSFGPLPPAKEAMLLRFFRVKLQSLHHCGRTFHDLPLIEGLRSLAIYPPRQKTIYYRSISRNYGQLSSL